VEGSRVPGTDEVPPAPDDPAENAGRTEQSAGGVSADADSRVIWGWSGHDPHDEDWLVEAARTDRAAFGVLYDRYCRAVYHYIARRVGDPDVAEDLTGAVWERALIAIERYEIRGVPFAAWLYRIAGNLVANHHRRRRLVQMVSFSRAHDVSSEGRSDEKTMVRQALLQLSADDQEVLGLCYYAGLTPPEIADVLGCTPAAVHKRLHRARERLRHRIEGDTRVSAPIG
jgi:RNA polymerase sigma-70 factor, ECF subfamily